MHTDAKLYYALLGLDPSCSDEEIRAAYRRRAKALHPDAESGDATAFIRLKRAYDTLNDPAKRARYDRVSTPRRARAMRSNFAPPPPPRVRPLPRSGGLSFARYCAAFLFMGGLSFGAIEVMIDYGDEPPPAGSPLPGKPSRAAGASLVVKDGSQDDDRRASRSGFWDMSTPDGQPAPTSDARRLIGPRANGIGASTLP